MPEQVPRPYSAENAADGKLVDRWKDLDDHGAAGELHARYIGRLLAAISANIDSGMRGRIVSESVANSAFGSVFLGVKADRFVFDNDQAFWKLLVTIALNKVRQRVRKKRPLDLGDVDVDATAGMDRYDPTPDELTEFSDLREKLFASLSEQQQQYLLGRELGLKQTEIAEKLGITDRHVRRIAAQVEIKANLLFGKSASNSVE